MATFEEQLNALHKKLGDYLSTVEEIVIDDNAPAAIARAPVQNGLSKFVSVEDLPNLDDLPFIPERMRDFAYRYATEYMKEAQWAREYQVTRGTITKWLQHPGVRSYIALARLEKRFYTMARRSALENMVWKRLHDFMNIKITGDNAGAVARILEFAWKILNDPNAASGAERTSFNQSIYVGAPSNNGSNPYAQTERDVTPKQLQELEDRMAQLRFLQQQRDAVDADLVEEDE